jgi:hypothetical protein
MADATRVRRLLPLVVVSVRGLGNPAIKNAGNPAINNAVPSATKRALMASRILHPPIIGW